MPHPSTENLLAALLDSWDRNNTILINLLRALPEDTLKLRPMEGSPSVGELFAHIHYVRLVFVSEDAPEFARPVPEEWVEVPDRDRMAELLNESAKTVRRCGTGQVGSGSPNGPSLRPSHPASSAHDLARGLPPRSDQADFETCRPPTRQQRHWTADLEGLDEQDEVADVGL